MSRSYFLIALFLLLVALPGYLYFEYGRIPFLGSSKNGLLHIGNYSNKLITDTGLYPVSDYTRLQIRIVETSIVDISLWKGNTPIQVSSSDYRFSDAMRWAVYWEPAKSRLWVMSSDIGSHLYEMQADGQFKLYDVMSTDLIKEMPEPIFQYHTESHKEEMAQYRSQ